MSGGPRADEIRAILDDLIRQRRQMGPATEPGLREANRLGIVYWQRQLELALESERAQHAA